MIQSLFSLKISWSWAAHREAEKEATNIPAAMSRNVDLGLILNETTFACFFSSPQFAPLKIQEQG